MVEVAAVSSMSVAYCDFASYLAATAPEGRGIGVSHVQHRTCLFKIDSHNSEAEEY